MILSPDALLRRISRLQALMAYLERVEPVDLAQYNSKIDLQLRIERVVQLAVQIIVDAGETILLSPPPRPAAFSGPKPPVLSGAKPPSLSAYIPSPSSSKPSFVPSGAKPPSVPSAPTGAAQPVPPPPPPGELMEALARRGILPQDLARRIADIPVLALVLAHEHEEINPAEVWKLWRERRKDLSAIASSFAAHIARNKNPFRS